jgi:hypothetical protein
MQEIATVSGPDGEALTICHVLATDVGVSFLRERLAADPEGWPVDPAKQGCGSSWKQSWGQLVEDTAISRGTGDPRLSTAELYILYLKGTNTPVACATLMATDMTPEIDPTLPNWVGALTPWRAGVAEAPGYEGRGYTTIIGAAVLRRAKELGFKVVHLFVSVPADGKIPASWRGFPCELVWRGRYCDHIPLPDERPRTELPDQMVLAVPLQNVPDAA